MLTDSDKCDLICFASSRTRAARSDCTRVQLVTDSTKAILHFIIEHPDVCAAEIDDFLRQSDDAFFQEIERLHQNGML